MFDEPEVQRTTAKFAAYLHIISEANIKARLSESSAEGHKRSLKA
jgi:hypothetical protein